MEVLRLARPYEDIYFDDPSTNPDTPHFRVWFDDESIETLLKKVANAIDRAQGLERKIKAATTDEERDEVTKMMVHLQKRVIVAFIGVDGYQSLLEWMGDGKAVDPSKHIGALGEIFAQFMMLLGKKATNEQLRECGLYYSQETAKTKAFLQSPHKVISGNKSKKRK